MAEGFLGDITNIQAQWRRTAERPLERGRSRQRNWRFYREFSGGLTAELGSQQIDVASWVFNDSPEFVTGVGALDWKKDDRDVYDNVALILRYPEGRQMTWSAISANKLECCREDRRPKAHLEAGFDNSAAVILANRAMDEGRRVQFGELGRFYA